MDNIPPEVWQAAHALVARANETSSATEGGHTQPNRPPAYKAVGLTLAIASGLFIGTSFVLKKTGLLKANAKYHEEAGEGYGYLKNAYWWSGMTLMIVGEICNFVAYAFVDAILVTPLGALSVVVTTILSAIFLKERLSFIGKVGCFNCIIGSVVIVMNAPEQSAVADIQQMKGYVLSPGFLTYAGIILVGCALVAWYVGPRYGKKSMLVYLSICSSIGGLSVVATQGLGSAVVAQAGGKPQFNQWFLYVLLVFVVATLLTEIVYLNKALNIFNAALVTPTYYVFFTSFTIITSAILFRGFKGTPVTIATVIMGFLVICSGVVLLQMSKSAKDVPDAAVFQGDLDQIREIGEQEQPETEPKADALRGTAALIRRISVARQKMEQEEARRLREDTLKDQLEPLNENEVVEWDGLRRRKTIVGPQGSPSVRRKTIHPPLGMSKMPDPIEEEEEDRRRRERTGSNFFEVIRNRANSVLHREHSESDPTSDTSRGSINPVALTDIKIHPPKSDSPIVPGGPGSFEEAQRHIYGYQPGHGKERELSAQPSPLSKPLPDKPPPSPSPNLKPPQQARRQFSFSNFLHRNSKTPIDADLAPPSRPGLNSRSSSTDQKRAMKNATEEERLGLVKGDSHSAMLALQSPEYARQPMLSTYPQSSSLANVEDEKFHDRSHSNLQYHASLSDSDEDDDTQMTRLPHYLPAQPMTPPRRTDSQVQQSYITPPHPSAKATVTPNSRRRPSPPRIYRPPAAQVPNYHQQNILPPVPTAAQTPIKVKPVTTVSNHFPNSSMSQDSDPPLPATAVSDSRQAPAAVQAGGGRKMTNNTPQLQSQNEFQLDLNDSQVFNTGAMRTITSEDYEASRRRFEEQSKREREERKRRAAAREKRASWKPGDKLGGSSPQAAREGMGGGNGPGGAGYI